MRRLQKTLSFLDKILD